MILLEGKSREWETGTHFWISKSFSHMPFTRNIISLVLGFIKMFAATQTFILIAYLLNVIAICALFEEQMKEGTWGTKESKKETGYLLQELKTSYLESIWIYVKRGILLGLSTLNLLWAWGSLLIFLYALLHKSLNE